MIDLSTYLRRIESVDTIKAKGKVRQVVGLVIESDGPPASVGDLCTITLPGNGDRLPCEVVGFRDSRVLLMPLGEMREVSAGAEVTAESMPLRVQVGEELRGRILDGLGRPLDKKGPVYTRLTYSVHGSPPDPLTRTRIKNVLPLGVRSMDAFLTCGKGQRLGIFSGSGVGKSLLLGMIARFTAADINVIALVGERGREVRDFIERDLGEEGLSRSVIVVATSDRPALVRLKAAHVAHAIAEFFRDSGYDVMFMMDSVTRLCFAQREVGLAVGEPPATKGYTPSVYAMLPKLLERSGTSDKGSVTGLYTVLVEGDDLSDPVADQVRSILDGHVVLSRELAKKNHYPAVDILGSVSRIMMDIVPKEHNELAGKVRELLAVYRDAEDLINIGAYVSGSNPKVDEARARMDAINAFLRQDVNERSEFQDTLNQLAGLVS